MNKRILIVCAVIVSVIVFFNLRIVSVDNEPETQSANIVETTIELDMEIVRNDPMAPPWMREAESCRKIGEKIFCNLKGE